jgi:hypothetical protein
VAAKGASSVYDQLLAVTHVYLGPAADRFINRQIENHLHKDPKNITRADLSTMVDWIRTVVSLISDDTEVIEEYVAELHKLAGDDRDA